MEWSKTWLHRLSDRRVRDALIGTALGGSALLTAFALREPESAAGVRVEASASAAADEASVAGVSWDLPVKRTDRVAYWKEILTGRRHAKMQQWLEQSGRYVPMIQRELRARGMPEDLVYLAFIESGFSPDAYSRTRAVGLWQFMEGTGKQLGLKVTPFVDQRRDPVAATDAALDFLNDLHNQFGSWWLAAAAYNCGPNRVARVMREVTGSVRGDDDAYWRISSRLPKETQDYVPLMIAAGDIAKAPEQYGFTELNYHAPLAFDSVQVPGGTKLATISKATGTDPKVLDQLNPHYVKDVTPPVKASEWAVRIPEGLTEAFVSNFPHLFAQQKAADARAAAVARERAAEQHRLAVAKRRAAHEHAARRHGTKSRRSHRRAANGHVSRRRRHRR